MFAEKSIQIVVISNSKDEPYQLASNGFKEKFKPATKYHFTDLTLPEVKSDKDVISRVKPDLIFALGTEAISWASTQTNSVPIIATLALKESDVTKSKNITGVSLNYSLKSQFQWLKKFFSQQKNVAILFNPKENANTIQSAREAALQYGFNLSAIPVESPKELPYALGQLAHNIEILLAIPDDTVMSVNTAKEVLLASFSNKVPLVGLSDNWVKSGALYALSWDYEDLGQQCAEMAQKVLDGVATPSTISPERPRKIAYTINTKIAEHMNIDIPPEIMKNAKKIFD